MTSVIFDLDGTLIDSVAAIRDIANTLLAELDLPPMDTAEARGNIGNGAAVFLEKTLRARPGAFEPATFDGLLARYQKIYAAAPGEANPPYPGADAVLRRLKDNGVRLGMCTNKPYAPTLKVVDALGWSGLFDTIIGGDTLPQRKPHPLPLRTAAERLGPDPIAYVGDSEVDAAAAEAAGIPFVLFTEGYRKSPIDQLPHAASFACYETAFHAALAAALPARQTA